MRLSDQHVFITGGGSGIGLALARGFLARGNRVTICGRHTERLEQAAAVNPGLEFFVADIATENGLHAVAAEMQGRLDTVSILVNNAAIGESYHLGRTPDAFSRLEAELATDLLAPLRLCRLFLPQLTARQDTAIVNISSAYALWPCPVLPGYAVAKSGLRAFTRILRAHTRGMSCKIFEVLPPLVDTRLVDWVDNSKITPAEVAEKTLGGMAKGKEEIIIGEVNLLCLGLRLWPWLTDQVMARYPMTLRDLDRINPAKSTDR